MLSSISGMLARIKVCWAHEFTDDVLTKLFLSVGCTWRDRLLTPLVTVRLFLVQVLHGNTACSALPHLSGLLQGAKAASVAGLGSAVGPDHGTTGTQFAGLFTLARASRVSG